MNESQPRWPTLVYDDARAAIVFLARAFGFTPAVLTGADGFVRRAELVWNQRAVAVLVSAASEEEGERSVTLIVPPAEDLGALHERAVSAGARSVRAPHEEEDGSRSFQVADPEGVLWSFRAQEPQSFAEPQLSPPPAQASAE